MTVPTFKQARLHAHYMGTTRCCVMGTCDEYIEAKKLGKCELYKLLYTWKDRINVRECLLTFYIHAERRRLPDN